MPVVTRSASRAGSSDLAEPVTEKAPGDRVKPRHCAPTLRRTTSQRCADIGSALVAASRYS